MVQVAGFLALGLRPGGGAEPPRVAPQQAADGGHGPHFSPGIQRHAGVAAAARAKGHSFVGTERLHPDVLQQQPGDVLQVVEVVAVDGHAHGHREFSFLEQPQPADRFFKGWRPSSRRWKPGCNPGAGGAFPGRISSGASRRSACRCSAGCSACGRR